MRTAFALSFLRCHSCISCNSKIRWTYQSGSPRESQAQACFNHATVKNGSDLAERSEHLMKSFRTLLERRRDYLKKGWGYNEFCKVQGAMYSYENTYNEKQVNGIRIFTCLPWLISGLISRNFQNIGIVLLVTRWLSMFAGREKKKDTAIAKRLPKSVSMLWSLAIYPLKNLGSIQGTQGQSV